MIVPQFPDNVALYYDLDPSPPTDVPFYAALIPSRDATVLELGCGTGRVLLPLVEHCGYIEGIDLSEAMLAVCRDKLHRASVPQSKARVSLADITNFNLRRVFNLIVAPYRLFENLTTESQLQGFFRCIDSHLSAQGTCILAVARPEFEPERLRMQWNMNQEMLCWDVATEDGRVSCYMKRSGSDPRKLILYRELTFRRYKGDSLIDQAAVRIAEQCYYPEELDSLISDHGFRIIRRWGGHEGEAYGHGPELIVQFTR